jgi:hypothetical protein
MKPFVLINALCCDALASRIPMIESEREVQLVRLYAFLPFPCKAVQPNCGLQSGLKSMLDKNEADGMPALPGNCANSC